MLAYRINWKNASLEERRYVDDQLDKKGVLYPYQSHIDRIDFIDFEIEEWELHVLDELYLPTSCTISRIN